MTKPTNSKGELNLEPNPGASLFPDEANELHAAGGSEILRTVRLLLLLVLVVGIGGGAFAWSTGRLDPTLDQFFPVVVQVKGRINLDGKPMSDGFIMTVPIDNNRRGMLGPIEKDGTFQLQLDDGPGAYSGRHRVTVSWMTKTFPPKSLLPDRYSQASMTPLMIKIPRNGEDPKIVLELTSDAESKPISEPSAVKEPAAGKEAQPVSTENDEASKQDLPPKSESK